MTLTGDRLARDVVQRALRSLSTPFDVTLEFHCVPPGFPRQSALTSPDAIRAIVGAHWASTEWAVVDSRADGWGVPMLVVPVDAVSTDVVLALDAAGWKRVAVERVWPGTGRASETLEDRARLIAQRAGERVWTLTASAQWGFLFPMRMTARERQAIPGTRWPRPIAR
jgi:hypothetical protein